MSNLTILFIALGLAMDAFAVSISSGITIKRLHLKHALLIAAFFGGFQALMPLIGWSAGHWAANGIGHYDHWIAFGLLTFIGAKMIHESRIEGELSTRRDPLNVSVLFVLAIATSIDALAVGLTLSFMDVGIMTPVLIIGAVTFVVSFAGTYIGDLVGHLFEKQFEILGGVILIGLGIKILVQHTLLGGTGL